jgi:hypothetical protein
MESTEAAVALVFGTVVLGGVLVIIAGMWHRARILEMAHRERLAMIERGLPPSSDFMQAYREQPTNRGRRLLSAGIVVIGLGVAVGMLIGFASREGEIALGVGGAIIVMGAAFVATALVQRHMAAPEAPASRVSTPWIDRPPSPPQVPQ